MNFKDIDISKLPSTITFTADDTRLVIASDGFYYNGDKIEDKDDIYNRFNDWLKIAIKNSQELPD